MTNRINASMDVTSNERVRTSCLCKNEQGQIAGANFYGGYNSAAFPDKSRIRTVRAPLD